MIPIRMRIYGTPAPQGSKRHVGGGRMIESSKKVAPWREAVVSEALRLGYCDERIDEPCMVRITFYLQRPAGHSGVHGIKSSAPTHPAKVPDLDKLIRSTLDGLTQASVLIDDSRVVGIDALKIYADDTGPGALIHITEILTKENT